MISITWSRRLLLSCLVLAFAGCHSDSSTGPSVISASTNAGDYFYAKVIGGGAQFIYTVGSSNGPGNSIINQYVVEDRIINLATPLAVGGVGIAVRRVTKDSNQTVVAVDTLYYAVSTTSIVEYHSVNDIAGRVCLQNPVVMNAQFLESPGDTTHVHIDSVGCTVPIFTLNKVYGTQTSTLHEYPDAFSKHVIFSGTFRTYAAGYFMAYGFQESDVYSKDTTTMESDTIAITSAVTKYP